MKKIIIFSLFVVFVTSCVAQNYEIFTNLKNAVESYETYLTNGNFRKAGQLEDDLLRYCSWLVLNLYSSADYDADSLAYAKDKLDVVAGVELNDPSYVYDAAGLIDITGTPTVGQIGLWSDANTLLGKDSLKWTAGRLHMLGKGLGNMFIGSGTGTSLTSGTGNTGIGISCGSDITTGGSNVLLGYTAGYNITTGSNNICIGSNSGNWITTGGSNINIGSAAGAQISTADSNVNIGYQAGYSNVTGRGNINIGYKAGYSETGSGNLYIDNISATKFNTLIWGDMNNDSLRLNAAVKVKTGLQVRDTTIIDLIEQHSSAATVVDSIAAHRTEISANLDSISTHRTEISANLDSISTHRTEIGANLDSIATHRTEISANLDSIADHRTDIEALKPSGSQYALQMSNGDATFTSDADFTIESDTLGGVHISISGATRFSKFKQSDTLGMYLTPNGVIDTMEWSRSAAWMLEHAKDIEPFDYFFNTRVNGEVNWPRCYGDSYHSINPSTAKAQYMGAFERTWIYMDDLYKRNSRLERELYEQKEKVSQLEQNINITQALTIQLLNKIKELEKKIDE